MKTHSNTKVIRKPYGKYFTYQFEAGGTVKNNALKRWIKALAIPPAWQDVVIELDRDAKVHAYGRDIKNRKQYIYNAAWLEQASEAKFNRVLRFAKQLPKLRSVTDRQITQTPIDESVVLACMTRMIDEAYFRPGHISYTRENKTFGLTTLRCKHMNVAENSIIFEYEGKSHQQQRRKISDKSACGVLKVLEDMPGYELFDITLPCGQRKKIKPSDLNNYIAQIMGEDFSAKDFRTWAGTVLMAVELGQCDKSEQKNSTKKQIVACVKTVAEQLGNTPAVCKSNYIHPEIITQFERGKTIEHFKKRITKSKVGRFLDLNEKATLKMLSSN